MKNKLATSVHKITYYFVNALNKKELLENSVIKDYLITENISRKNDHFVEVHELIGFEQQLFRWTYRNGGLCFLKGQ